MFIDELWPSGPKIYRSPDVLPLGTDSVLLSDFASASAGTKTVCDLGCGSGIISILLSWDHPERKITGVELQPEVLDVAKKNIELNGIENVDIVQGDMRDTRSLPTAGGFDLTVSNPPYFPVSSGKSSDNPCISIAREEIACSLSDVCKAASYLTRWGGKFMLVHRPERLAEIFCRLSENGLEPKRMRFVHSKRDSLPNLVLIESRRGGKPGLTYCPPLIISNDDGTDTEEIKRIYHRP